VKKRPGLLKGFLSFVNLCVIILSVRWLLFEVFVIPSGSMYPKLYVNDYLIVSKYNFGLRVPFTKTWALGPYLPKRNSVVVFLSQDESKYLIKRLVALPGDKVLVAGDFVIELNGEKLKHTALTSAEEEELSSKMGFPVDTFDAYYETGDAFKRVIMVEEGAIPPSEWSEERLARGVESYEPPKGYILFMGDNRNRSHDGRYFGYVPAESLVGLSRFVGLSCESRKVGSGCDPTRIRTQRLLMGTSE